MKSIVKRGIHFLSNRTNKVMDRLFERKYPLLNPLYRYWMVNANGVLGVVYMLHRVADFENERLLSTEDLKVTPFFLESVITQYKKQGFDFYSLDQISEYLDGKRLITKPFVSFTLDDGYLDNYTNAYPVFKRNQVPFCVYVATDFIDKKAILWWYSVEDLILGQSQIKINDGTVFSCISRQEKWDTFRILREKILRLNQDDLFNELNHLFSGYTIDWYAPVRSKAMSWEQVELMSKDSLCTIGGHTVSHSALSHLSYIQLTHEIKDSLSLIESHIHQPVQHFSYPYGSTLEVGEREFSLMENMDIHTAFCSHGGCFTKEQRRKVDLPRVMLHQK